MQTEYLSVTEFLCVNAETRSVSSDLPMIFLKPNKCNVRFCATDELGGKKEEEIGTYD